MQNATMRVLVTGGTGFVGGWTAKAIADAGHSVRFLVRNPARLKTSVAKLGVDVSDFAVADISDRDSVREALNGCDAVVHSAALVATDPRETSRMLSTNMAGAQNVLGPSWAVVRWSGSSGCCSMRRGPRRFVRYATRP